MGDSDALVEKKIKRVWLADKQRYGYLFRNSPHLQDSKNPVIE